MDKQDLIDILNEHIMNRKIFNYDLEYVTKIDRLSLKVHHEIPLEINEYLELIELVRYHSQIEAARDCEEW